MIIVTSVTLPFLYNVPAVSVRAFSCWAIKLKMDVGTWAIKLKMDVGTGLDSRPCLVSIIFADLPSLHPPSFAFYTCILMTQ